MTEFINAEKERRARRAWDDFPEAAKLASTSGLRLVRNTDIHYQLLGPVPEGGASRVAWILNLYPSSGRIYHDTKRGIAPYLDLAGKQWTLMDAVNAAIEKSKE